MCVCVCVRLFMYVCARVCGAADFTDTYVNIYNRYIGIGNVYTGWGSVRETAVGFRYDTVDRTVRIFGIEALSLGKR